MKNKIFSLLLCICLIIAPLCISVTAQQSGGEALVEKITFTSDGTSVKVEGNIPHTAELIVTPKEVPDDFSSIGGASVQALDIKLVDGGRIYQPQNPVNLTIDGIEPDEQNDIGILHLLDDADAIEKAVADGTALVVSDPEIVASHRVETNLAFSVTGVPGVLYAEYYSTANGNVLINSDNTISVVVSSFSEYWILSGNSSNGNTENDITTINDGSDTNIYYVAPGTVLRLARENTGNAWWGVNRNNVNGVRFSTSSGNVSTNAYITGSGSLVQGHNFTQGDNLIVNIASNAKLGETYEVTSYRGATQLTLNNKKNLRFVVMSQEDVVRNVLDSGVVGTQYPVYLTVLKDASLGIPGEPCLASGTWYYMRPGHAGISTSTVTFSPNGNGIIASDIIDNSYFENARDGTNTMGIADASGIRTKAVLSGVDWDVFLNYAAALGDDSIYSNNIRAADGQVVTSQNKHNYEVLPYVVKLQTAYSLGWHVDCYINPKEAIQVSYNANIPEGYVAPNITIPIGKSGASPLSVTIGKVAQNGVQKDINGTVSATNEAGIDYTLTFKGWNTKSDGSGTSYTALGATEEFTQTTVLYAIWDSSITTGTLDISKYVILAAGSADAPETDEFTFTVTFPNTSGARNYSIYSTVGVLQSSGTISSGGTVKFRADQWVRIFDVPVGSYTVSEEDKDHYSQSSAGATGTIRGGATSTAVFTNTYNVPAMVNYTVKHWKQNADGTYTVADIETGSGTIGTAPTYTEKSYTNFDFDHDDAAGKLIAADGSTVVNAYYKRQTASLRITKSGMQTGEKAIFKIFGEGLENGLTVVVDGNSGSVTIVGLCVGAEYTVTEQSGWSWKYNLSQNTPAAQKINVTEKGTIYQTSFTNTTRSLPWLSGEDMKHNRFGLASNS